MNILVFNSGSSSLKYRLIDSTSGKELCGGLIERIGAGVGQATHRWSGTDDTGDYPAADHSAAFGLILSHLQGLERKGKLPPLHAAGHRVVHGGDRFTQPVRIDAGVESVIEQLAALAPLHNPPSLAVIHLSRKNFPTLPQVAVFDTAFHHTMPERAYRYAVPDAWFRQHGVRRYGFHGISHHYAARCAAGYLGKPLENIKLITLHLGNGASAAAIDGGRSIDTSMGMTPLEGLVMGTRCGDMDIAAALYIGRETGLDFAQLENQLTQESGLKGLGGASDMREIIARSTAGDRAAQLALEIYSYRIRKYVGAYLAVLGGLDVLVFTGGVGENAPEVRAMVCSGLEHLGIRIDPARNASAAEGIVAIGQDCNIAILVIPANEELEIARQVRDLLAPS